MEEDTPEIIENITQLKRDNYVEPDVILKFKKTTTLCEIGVAVILFGSFILAIIFSKMGMEPLASASISLGWGFTIAFVSFYCFLLHYYAKYKNVGFEYSFNISSIKSTIKTKNLEKSIRGYYISGLFGLFFAGVIFFIFFASL
jgi:hypothetical protein